jgi:hypothetical protein
MRVRAISCCSGQVAGKPVATVGIHGAIWGSAAPITFTGTVHGRAALVTPQPWDSTVPSAGHGIKQLWIH